MKALELKVPPPVVALLVCAAMWALARVVPASTLAVGTRASVAFAIALVGGGFSMAGGMRFRKARTTVNPMRPQATSALVTSGIYARTRNPMYVGILCVVLGWLVFLGTPWVLPGPAVFVLYMNRFQIGPEERVLQQLFGAEYAAYRARVRRWL